MRPFSYALLIAALIVAPASGGFELSLQNKSLQGGSSDQTIDIYLKSTFSTPVEIHEIHIGAYIGSSSNVSDFGGQRPVDYVDPEGNFVDVRYANDIQFTNPGVGGYFWDEQQSGAEDLKDVDWWGRNVVQARAYFVQYRTSPDYRELGPNDSVKIGTFHIDTRGMTTDTLNISLYGKDSELQYTRNNGGTTETSPPFLITSVITTSGGPYEISDPNMLKVVGSTSFSISHTPEPAVIGFAGLGLASGLGWLRARSRKRKTAS